MKLWTRLRQRLSRGNFGLAQRYRRDLVDQGRPREMNLALVEHCFARCSFCHLWYNPPTVTEEHGLERHRRLLAEFRELAGRYGIVHFSSGEPLMARTLFPLVRHAQDIGLLTHFSTNGGLVTEAVARDIDDSGLRGLQVSLHSPDQTIHDELMGRAGMHQAALAALERLRSVRRTTLTVSLNCVILERNYRDLPRYLEWASGLPRVTNVFLNALSQPFGDPPDARWHESDLGRELFPDDRDAMASVLDTVITMKRSRRYRRVIQNPVSQLTAYQRYYRDPRAFLRPDVCHLAEGRGFSVDVHGNVVLCHQKEPLGNIHNHTLAEIWRCCEAETVRASMRSCSTNCHQIVNCLYQEG